MLQRTRTWPLTVPEWRTQRNAIRPITGGDGSTLSFDFTQGVLDTRLSFTRTACTCTYINNLGYVTTVTAANIPRFDYDPVTLLPLGLLAEASATNLLTYSETFATDWTDTSITRNSTTETSPSNSANALRVTASSGNATIIRTSAIGSSAARTFSLWMRRNSGTGDIQYTLNNGTGWTTQAITSTWTRYVFAATTADQQVGIRIVTSGDSIEIWGAQLEAGSGASSYIPTTTAAGNRNADLVTMSDITAAGYSTTNGTLYYSGRFTKINSVSYPTRAGFQTTGGAQPTFEFFTNGSSAFTTARSAGGNAEVSLSISTNTDIKWAAAFDAALATGEMRVSLNGASVATSGGPVLTATYTPNIFAIGRSGYDAYFPCGTIKQVKYWPTTLADNTLKLMTT